MKFGCPIIEHVTHVSVLPTLSHWVYNDNTHWFSKCESKMCLHSERNKRRIFYTLQCVIWLCLLCLTWCVSIHFLKTIHIKKISTLYSSNKHETSTQSKIRSNNDKHIPSEENVRTDPRGQYS